MSETRRQRTNLTIDGRVLEKIKLIAEMRGISVSQYVEEYFFREFKRIGMFPPEEKPPGENRGGDRTKPSEE